MVSHVQLSGFDEFHKYTEAIDPNGPPVLFYFSGSKTPDGNSWCPDCVEGKLLLNRHFTSIKLRICV